MVIGNYYLLVAEFGNRIRKWPLRKGFWAGAGTVEKVGRYMDKHDIQSSISIIKWFYCKEKLCLTELLSLWWSELEHEHGWSIQTFIHKALRSFPQHSC